MASNAFENAFRTLEDMGFVDVVLPFLLIFAVIYAVLQKTHILGEGKKNLNAVLAVVISLLTVFPHVTGRYPRDADPILILNNAIPQVSLIIVAVVFLLILIGVFGQDKVFLGASAPGWVLFFSLIAIIWIFGASANWWGGGGWVEQTFGPDAVSIFIMILVFGVIIMMITAEPRNDGSRFGVNTGRLYPPPGGGGGGGGHP